MSSDTTEYNGYTITMRQDTDGDDHADPRQADNLGVMLCQHRDYTLGDESHAKYLSNKDSFADAKRAFDYYADREYDRGGLRAFVLYLKTYLGATVVLPLGLIDHSGISMYVGGGAHPMDPGGWDSGTVGFIFDTAASREMTGCTPEIGFDAEAVTKTLRAEVKEYDKYLTGDVWGHEITDPDGDDVEDASCWGILGYDDAVELAKNSVDEDIAHRLTTAKPAPRYRTLALIKVADANEVLGRPLLQSELETLRAALVEQMHPVFAQIVRDTFAPDPA